MSALAHVRGDTPGIYLEGTETGGKKYRIRENAGKLDIYDVDTGAVIMTDILAHAARHEHNGADEVVGILIQDVAANRPAAGTANRFFLATDTMELSRDNGTAWDRIGVLGGLDLTAHAARHVAGGADALSGLTAAQLAANTIKIAVPITIPDSNQAGLSAATTGVKWTSNFKFKIDPQNLKSAVVRATWTATNTDSVTAIEVYDETATTILGSVSGNAGTNTEGSVTGFTAGNVVTVRLDVTTASATSTATTSLTYAVLELTYGAS